MLKVPKSHELAHTTPSNMNIHVRTQRGGGGAGGLDPLLKNHKNIEFLSNTGPDPLKNHKATKPAINVGPMTSETPFNGVSLVDR